MADRTENRTTTKTHGSQQKLDFDNGKIGAETESPKNRSYVAMILSAILPGLGQFILGTIPEGIYYLLNICFSSRHFLSQFHASQ